MEGEFWYALPRRTPADWQDFIAPVLAEKLDHMYNASTAAVLFVRVDKRVLVYTFGRGKNLLKSELIEMSFGLRVALNRINHLQMRSMDIRTYEELAISTRKQTSRSSDLGTFGLDVTRDLLRAVTGEPENKEFASRLTGSDSLTISAPVNVQDLGMKAQEILTAYKQEHYREHFDWVDHLREVRDKEEIEKLNSRALKAMREGALENLYLAVPDPIDWQEVDKFLIEGTGSKEYDDLDIDEYLRNLGEKRSDLTIQKLKNRRVKLRSASTGQNIAIWSLYKCPVWETHFNKECFALVEGRWFRIEENFAKEVRDYVSQITEPENKLPPARANELEPNYNQRVATQRSDVYFLLDRIIVRPQAAASGIEFCDLLSNSGQFIHVKRKTKSSTLSHLFSQGSIAARTFLEDPGVRSQLREILRKESQNTPSFSDIIPSKGDRPNASAFEVAYVMIAKKKKDREDCLPFFSQLNLMQNSRMLRGLGYRVTFQVVFEEYPADEVPS